MRNMPTKLKERTYIVRGHFGGLAGPYPKLRHIIAAKIEICEAPTRQIGMVHLKSVEKFLLRATKVSLRFIVQPQFDIRLSIIPIEIQRGGQQVRSMLAIKLCQAHV